MKYLYFLYFSIIVLYGFVIIEPIIITEHGIGKIMLKESTLEDIKNVYPNGKEEKETLFKKKQITYVTWAEGGCSKIKRQRQKITLTTYILEEKNISFFLGSNNILGSISVWGKGKYKTENGLVIGKHTFNDLDSIYGETPWIAHISGNCKLYKNIRFYPKKSISTKKTYYEDLKNYNNEVIEKATIFIKE